MLFVSYVSVKLGEKQDLGVPYQLESSGLEEDLGSARTFTAFVDGI